MKVPYSTRQKLQEPPCSPTKCCRVSSQFVHLTFFRFSSPLHPTIWYTCTHIECVYLCCQVYIEAISVINFFFCVTPTSDIVKFLVMGYYLLKCSVNFFFSFLLVILRRSTLFFTRRSVHPSYLFFDTFHMFFQKHNDLYFIDLICFPKWVFHRKNTVHYLKSLLPRFFYEEE